MESDILFGQLTRNETREDHEQTLTRLIHASLGDEGISISYFSGDDIYYTHDMVDAGRFCIEGYTVEKADPESYTVQLAANYNEVFDVDDEHATPDSYIDGHVTYQLTMKVSPMFYTGQGKVFAIPKV